MNARSHHGMRLVVVLAATACFAATACKKGKDSLSPMTSEELKAKDTPRPPPPPRTTPAAPANGPRAFVPVPELGVKVEAPVGWTVAVPIPDHYTVKGASLQDGFVQVNKAATMPATPDEAAAQRCGGNAKVIAKEKTPAGAIFVMCESEFQGNKSRSINAWLKKEGAPAAAHCTITTDRNLELTERICRSLAPL